MEVVITGSGGCQITPKPCCTCNVCENAREKGLPYARNGPSMWVDGVLFDTPAEIAVELNNARIPRVDAVFYTHSDPDHVNGLRVVEELNWSWRTRKPLGRIVVYAPGEVYTQVRKYSSHWGPFTDYYEKNGMAEYEQVEWNKPVEVNGLSITPVKVEGEDVAVYVIEKDGKKIVYAPCDCKPFPEDERLKNADVFIMACPWYDKKFSIAEDDPTREELFSEEQTNKIIAGLSPKMTIITHIEEVWQLTHDEYKEMETDKLKFAYDGMRIEL